MRPFRTALIASVVAALALMTVVFVPVSAGAATGNWVGVELKPLAPGDSVIVYDINNAGTSVGISGINAVRWDPAGNPTLLPAPTGCARPQASNINTQGDIAGISQCNGNPEVATIWHTDGTITTTQSLFVAGFNDDDTLAGAQFASAAAFEGHAAIALPGAGTQTLAEGGGRSSRVAAITNTYLAVGSVRYTNPTTGLARDAAVGWYGPYVFPLYNGGADSTEAVAANDAGYSIVTITPAGGGNPYSVIVAPHGQAFPLAPGKQDAANDINNAGIAVGTHTQNIASVPTFSNTAMLYAYGTSVALPDLLSPSAPPLIMQSAVAINDNDWIVGRGAATSTRSTSWLMRPPS